MPTNLPVPTKAPGDVITSSLWNSYVRDNLNKLLNLGHRTLTVAAFVALTGLEDGDEVYLEVDATNGICWHLRYRAASGSAFKWEFLGGGPLYAAIATNEAAGTGAYGDATTPGPSVTVPRAGDYEITFKSDRAESTTDTLLHTAAKLGAAATVDSESIAVNTPNAAGRLLTASSPAIIRTLAASDVVKLQYKNTGASANGVAARRTLQVRPVRIS